MSLSGNLIQPREVSGEQEKMKRKRRVVSRKEADVWVQETRIQQGCQMVYFKTKKRFGYILEGL
jgi:hypothetical protein